MTNIVEVAGDGFYPGLRSRISISALAMDMVILIGVVLLQRRCGARDHLDFICRMKDYISRQEFINRTISALGSQFSVTSMELESLEYPNDTKFAPSTRLLRKQELEECFESESGNDILQSLRYAKVSTGDAASVSRFIPPEDFNLALLILDLEFVKKGTKDEQVDAVSLANLVRKRFANQVKALPACLLFKYFCSQWFLYCLIPDKTHWAAHMVWFFKSVLSRMIFTSVYLL
ncbi:putative protein disulfide-isomerase 5-2-like [Capsicum annuum]|nr:putative protein disulfide-isomerase 5-2-like [Capsicum annuum]